MHTTVGKHACPMNTIRLFIFAIALLSTAFLLRAIVDHFSPEEPIEVPVAASGTSAPAHAQAAADRSSP
jgi:hypothetical protein